MITKYEIDHVYGYEAVFIVETTELDQTILDRITAKTGLTDYPEWFAVEFEFSVWFDGEDFEVKPSTARLQVRVGKDLFVVYLQDDEIDLDDLAQIVQDRASNKVVQNWYYDREAAI